MAQAKYKRWLEPAALERVTNWVANGCSMEQLARHMGIHHSTLGEWLEHHPAFSEAVQKGRDLSLPTMENVFYNKARGGIVVTETVEEFRGEVVDGKPYNGVIVKRTVKKTLPPDTTALIFYLKNRGGYRSEVALEQAEQPALERAREILEGVPSCIGQE